MADTGTLPLLSQIKGARTCSEQAAALRALRDEIIGHVQRKEGWVKCGVSELLVNLLRTASRPSTSQDGKRPCGQSEQVGILSEDEAVRLLCLQLLASFMHGGASYLRAFSAAGVVPVVLSNVSPLDNPPQIVQTALRVLTNIAAAAQLAPTGTEYTDSLTDAVFTSGSLESLYLVLSQESEDTVVQEQKRLVMYLINRLCSEPHHQNALADSGIVDALATMLASFVVARGEVVPGAEILGQADGMLALIPPPAASSSFSLLADVLEALSTIVAGSRFRASLLLCSPAIMAVFPSTEFSPVATESKIAWDALEMSGLANIRSRSLGAVDYLLPVIPVPQPRSLSSQFSQFPPLGYSPSRDNLASSARISTFKFTGWDANTSGEDPDLDEPESPLIPWLIHLARSTDGLARTMAASLVTSLFKAGFANPEREQALALLLVPLLCQLMREHDKEIPKPVQQAPVVEPNVMKSWVVRQKAPEVLARLVADSETLQQAAHECGAIELVVKLLKSSYEPQAVQSAPRPWFPSLSQGMGPEESSPTCQVGPPGKVPAYSHKMKMRESALKLVAAMATLKEDYRKALADQELVSYIVESLSPSPGKPRSAKEKAAAEKAAEEESVGEVNPYGQNPDAVIVAACHATRALARSVSVLRTALQDHGVAIPISKLLRHNNAQVQIAASSAVINLVTNCSPMVKPLLEVGIVRILCEQAHSLNPGLRLNSLWALKHLVVDVDNDLKKQCLEELEPGWLVQLISDDTSEEEALEHARSRSARRATDADDDEDMDTDAAYEDDGSNTFSWAWPALGRVANLAAGSSPRLQQASQKLAALRDAELNPARRARNDNLAIQEQGLGFIRNLIMLTTPSDQTDMVDYLFSELGQDRLFSILADKLKVRVVGALGRRHTNSRRGRADNNSNNNSTTTTTATTTTSIPTNPRDAVVLYPQARIIENLTYILVHIAASVPRHRQLVVAQTELLKLLGGHFGSRDVGVRRALCQLFMNLLCLDSDGDRLPCEQRASELERLGFLAKLEGLEREDADLDVRERAKAAVGQLKGGGV
ncbi:hypothetical protein VTK26DRAFT_2926 [Humicola hyalothermophila]